MDERIMGFKMSIVCRTKKYYFYLSYYDVIVCKYTKNNFTQNGIYFKTRDIFKTEFVI